MSVRDFEKKTLPLTVQRSKKREGLKTYRKQKPAKVSENQIKTINTRARKLYDYMGSDFGDLVMDDE
jgi:transposase